MDKDICNLTEVNASEIKNIKAEQMEMKSTLSKIQENIDEIKDSVALIRQDQAVFISEIRQVKKLETEELKEISKQHDDHQNIVTTLKTHKNIQWFMLTAIISILVWVIQYK